MRPGAASRETEVTVEILLLTSATGSADQPACCPRWICCPTPCAPPPATSAPSSPAPAPTSCIIDARAELAEARATCRMLHATGLGVPAARRGRPRPAWSRSTPTGASTTSSWPPPARPRSRPGCGWPSAGSPTPTAVGSGLIRAGELTIDPDTYAAKLKGRPLDLTYKEFELLKFLAQHPGRVFTRDQLLREVWGYDYFGGTRTVDVHVRRLRAKLGSEYESMIGTVRQVGLQVRRPAQPDAARRRPDRRLPRASAPPYPHPEPLAARSQAYGPAHGVP